MTVKLENIFLIAGMLVVILSFIFFGRATDTYNSLLLAGLIVCIVSYLVILYRKNTLKSKFIWTIIIVTGIVIQQLSEPLLIKLSYSIFVKKNEIKLRKICDILKTKSHNSYWAQDSTLWKQNSISEAEGNTIRSLIGGTNIIDIFKDSTGVFFRTFGMLDTQHGVYYYFIPDSQSSNNLDKLFGNWYY